MTLTRQGNEPFGLYIIPATSMIGRIYSGSAAERSGRLKSGDRVLAVNRVDIKTLTHSEIVSIIKDFDTLHLIIGGT